MKIFLNLSACFALFIFCEGVCAQSLEVEYEESWETVIQMNINGSLETHKSLLTQNMVLLCNNGISLYESLSLYKGNMGKSQNVGEVSGIQLTMETDDSKIYKNQIDNEFITEESIFDRKFLVMDTMKVFGWNLLNEDAEINGYKCKKAVTGDTIVWYSPDVPVNNGPGIFWGLPGLIIKIQYLNTTITATKINWLEDVNLIIEKPEKGKKITRGKFDKLYEKKHRQRGNTPQTRVSLDVEITPE